ncbi:hypothetical protein ACFJGW_00745 [Burkholderiaceae bacterium UC74_6]
MASVRMGKYSVEGSASQRDGGKFVGTASLVWDDDDATCEKLMHFHKAFDSEVEAIKHALAQVQLRVNDGLL